MDAKVSILIPCYNAEQWIGEAIESSLNQSYLSKEIIVVDDGSIDRSLKIIKSFGNSIIWKTSPNRGGNVARNYLLKLSTGEWLQYLDADDYLLPDKVEKQVKYLAQVPQTDILYSPSIFEYHQHSTSWQKIREIPEPHDPWILLARWYLPQTGSPLWRRQAIVDVGGWKVDQPCCQEHELYLRLLIAGKKFEYFSEAGSVYRQWSESTVCKRDKSETHRQLLAIEDKIEQHLKATNQLTQLRHNAINQTRFETARMIWLSDKNWANEVIAKIINTNKGFIPSGLAAPKSYRLIYRLLGFSTAEQVAKFKRLLNYKLT
ncbi:glycosyltransferase [Anabaena cylindrica FACHB-243]|uniref:Glycosyl transferase family 2 n=1 Tax=Anabaena cylindrica (strain ATCC 27899 / PCC 7122) TaxID=272123 RepID=K9ZKT4_ANACC|nr:MULTISPECIES: glycosyltransferase [Anabaena]AFZ59162.1 glycosyl transferase family 2 [Anabaena cylindrica PCC 7122]MBD2416512.1 glycosyltransferase [Anabaena cylindrica FACHB-243]MBY5281084.1 glycosyltransferase [Anabaena sp. CCAP 1446/1C]MBY5309871.1 glycosyltransferase [Anabaena sp. CCAP 1446/1C]MCM2407450.1 glycosyltransferase [Anabaena sp. CCAP 1446/1C]